MPELRWILLGAGALLVAGLWWWESRRARGVEESEPRPEPGEGAEDPSDTRPMPALDPVAIGPGPEAEESDLPPIRARRGERAATDRRPPVVTVPEDAEPELSRAKGAAAAPRVSYRDMHDRLDDIPEDLKNLPPHDADDAEQRLPWVSTQPMERDEILGKRPADAPTETGDDATGIDSDRRREEGANRQRIVALRLVAHAGRWPGRALIQALEAEGLTYGKYSIYHRERDDGKTIYYVASMIEPGSFDLDRIDALSFPGVSIFAVIPGPVDAPTTFDMMLATARRLAEQLKGHLQDEQGSTLTVQRTLSLREELVQFEHVTQRLRKL